MNIILEQFELGPMDNFLYFIGDPSTRKVAIIDPAWDVDAIRQKAKDKGYTIVSIFLTHGHMDHVNGIDELQSTHDIPVYLSKYEDQLYIPQCKNLKWVDDKDILTVGKVQFECLHTPGHTSGGQCFRNDDVLIVGDTLFVDGCGRCDLPGGDAKVMYHTLHSLLASLPETTIIYPGHDYGPKPFDTLKNQKETNPYLHPQSEKEFLQERMGV